MKNKKIANGFTLIELLIVIAIVGLLSSVVLASLNTARNKAKIARVQADLNEFRKAVLILEQDTEQGPSHVSPFPCVQSGIAEIYLNSSSAGIVSQDGGFSNWAGPYMSNAPNDPWDNQYIFDPDYACSAGVIGCENLSGITVRAIHSGGPNKSGINVYDADNIVLVLCR